MFYAQKPDDALRFGDVVRGFVLSSSDLESPLAPDAESAYGIKVVSPPYCVVLSPCCSIGGKTLALAPLQKIPDSMLKNPNWAEDFTCINRPMPLEKSVPPEQWKTMTQEDKDRRGNKNAYALSEFFVYGTSPLLPKYDLKYKEESHETGDYMVDFRRIYRIECRKVNGPKQAPLEAKILQLSIQVRGDLRDKLAQYFGRVPKEDEV